MKVLSETVTQKFEAKVTPTISEKGIGLDANKSYDAIVEVIERVIERQEGNCKTVWTTKNTVTDTIITVTTDKGISGRFGSEFFHPISA